VADSFTFDLKKVFAANCFPLGFLFDSKMYTLAYPPEPIFLIAL